MFCVYLPLSSFLFAVCFLAQQFLHDAHVQLLLVLLLSGQTLHLQPEVVVQFPASVLLSAMFLLLLRLLLLQELLLQLLQLQRKKR